VRRIVPATIVRLASYSEDWNQLRPDTVEPKVVLTPFRDADLDFYENRVAVRLVDNLWQEVSRRLHAVKEIETGIANIDDYVAQALGHQRRMQGRLFQMIADMPYDQAWRGRIRERKRNSPGSWTGSSRFADVASSRESAGMPRSGPRCAQPTSSSTSIVTDACVISGMHGLPTTREPAMDPT
jgi:hypothetical protein